MNHAGHALLTLVEAPAYLQGHPRTMSRLLQQPLVPGVRTGRQWRVRKTDLAPISPQRCGTTPRSPVIRPPTTIRQRASSPYPHNVACRF